MKLTQFKTALKAVLTNQSQNLNDTTIKQLVEDDDYLDEQDLYVLEAVEEAMQVFTERLNDERSSDFQELKKEFKNHSHVDGEVKTPSRV